jgi:hypothetical protein
LAERGSCRGQLDLSGLAAGDYRLAVDETSTPLKIADSKAVQVIDLPIGPTATAQISFEKAR